MKPTSRILKLAASVLAGALLAGGSYALGAGSASKTIRACEVKSSGELLVRSHCSSAQSRITWNIQGPRGDTGSTGPQGPPAAAAWASVASGNITTVVLDRQNLSVQPDGNGVYTLTASGPCINSGNPSEVVTPSVGGSPSTNGIPVAYVVTPNGPENVFQIVTGANSATGTFTQGNQNFSVAVYCHQS